MRYHRCTACGYTDDQVSIGFKEHNYVDKYYDMDDPAGGAGKIRHHWNECTECGAVEPLSEHDEPIP